MQRAEENGGGLLAGAPKLPLSIAARIGTRNAGEAVAYSCGYWTVEASGELYRVFGPLVDAGYEYEIGEKWFPANHPRVIAAKKEWANQSAARTLQNRFSDCSPSGLQESIPSPHLNADESMRSPTPAVCQHPAITQTHLRAG